LSLLFCWHSRREEHSWLTWKAVVRLTMSNSEIVFHKITTNFHHNMLRN
jgi:hypothetical protein